MFSEQMIGLLLVVAGVVALYGLTLWRLPALVPYLDKMFPHGVGVRAIITTLLVTAAIGGMFVAIFMLGDESKITLYLIGSITTALGTAIAFTYRAREQNGTGTRSGGP